MVSVAEAEKIILSNLFVPESEYVPLDRSNRKVLAEEIRADRDLPAYDRATMDGIAISVESIASGQNEFRIEGVQAAGQPLQTLVDKRNCFEIMTGAQLPQGTNAVVPYENVAIENKIAKLLGWVEKNQNIHFRGSDARLNDVLLKPGLRISPAEVALLAAVGKWEVKVFKPPMAAVISTGDELVDINQAPLPHQIRKSNSYSLAAALNELGCKADQFHLVDDKGAIKEKMDSLLKTYELIVLSGGVSKGKFDFVPNVLESLGVKKLLHHISQRPGKPMWFGKSEGNTVFALPGNPVSTFMCFHRYLKPWLTRSMGLRADPQFGLLAQDFEFAPSLTYFLQVKVQNENGRLIAYPITGGGSGDFANLKDVDGFLELPLERSEFQKGEALPLILFR